ncbi:MAG: TonB-dependent receptor family protein [Mediterranea sp.]|jgi:hypothetical protein|nr:TonB-dependent receptor family protein [Mediterranea sp.]
MKLLFLQLLLLFGATTHIYARQLSGKVVNSTGQPVAYANVVLLTTDSVFITGAVSNDDGEFALELTPNASLLKVSYIGYREKVLPIPTTDTHMGSIVLDDDALVLQEVVVKASIPVTRIKGDALVTNVQGSILEKAGTANDVLSKLPGVTLENGALNVFERGNPTIYINGRQVRDQNELSRLTSDNIESVEVVSNPGVRYAKSIKAVIRIRTKRNTDNGFGFNERANVAYNSYWSGSNQLSLYYRHNGFDASGMIYYNEGKSWRRGELNYKNYLNDFWENQSMTTQLSTSKRLYTNLSLNYVFNERHSIGANYSFDRNPGNIGDLDFASRISKNQTLVESTTSDILTRNQYSAHEADFYYNGTIQKWVIDFNASMVSSNAKGNNATAETITQSDGNSEKATVTTTDFTDNTLYAAKLSIAYPLWEGDLTFGGEYSHTTRHNNYSGANNLVAANVSQVNEGLAAGFVEYSRAFFEKLQLQAGVRFENVLFDYYETGEYKPEQSRNYNNLFPTVSVSYPIGRVNLQLGYSSDVERPTFNMLSNRITYINRYTYMTGNPFLLPNITHSATLKSSYRWLQFYASFNRSKDNIITTVGDYLNNPSIGVEKHVNTKPYNYVSFMLSASPTIGAWSPQWEARLYKQWYITDKPGGSQGEQISMNRLAPTFRWNNAFRLPHGFLLNAGFTWRGKRDETNVTIDSYWTTTASLYKGFLNEQLTFLLSGNDLFDTSGSSMVMYSGRQQTSVKNRFTNRSVSLTVSYKFNQKRSKYKGTGAGNEQRSRM